MMFGQFSRMRIGGNMGLPYNLTKDQAIEVAKRVMSKFGRELCGDEYDQTLTMLRLLEPNCVSNNQRFWTDTYIVGELQYDVTFGLEDKPVISVKESNRE